jgi:hypothetical protein
VHLPLRKLAASLQTVRSIAWLSRVFSTAPVSLAIATSLFISCSPPASQRALLLFSTDNTLLVGSPVLIQWYPSAFNSADGVMICINIELLGELILNAKSSLITGIGLSVGDRTLSAGPGWLIIRCFPASP